SELSSSDSEHCSSGSGIASKVEVSLMMGSESF
ncbi:hypothetical protein A2U01_0118000, partial [Trifolium medium]|nr:hypothetical protein [Trifolium medium]